MKLLHTSDWHLGKNDGDTSLYNDQLFFIDEICRIIDEKKIDAVLVAGDVFDRSYSSAEAAKLYDIAMTRICIDCSVPVYIIAGNHDGAERLSSCGELLKKAGLHIAGELKNDVSPTCLGNCEVYQLPWITEEKVKAVFPEEKDKVTDLAAAYSVVTEKMRFHFGEGKKHIILAHAFITNAETSTSDRAAEIGFAAQVPASVFEGFDYVALGHIHGPQSINDSVRYCGTPMPYSFGKEENQTKGVVVIDTETMEQEFVPVKLLHKRTTIECTLSEALELERDSDVLEGYVRLRITDSYIGLQALYDLKKIYRYPLVVEGKSYESEDSTVTLTVRQLEEIETDPSAVFKYFYREETGEEVNDHLAKLFLEAVAEVDEEEKI